MKNKIYAILFDSRSSDAMKLTRIEALLRHQPTDWYSVVVIGVAPLMTFAIGLSIGVEVGCLR